MRKQFSGSGNIFRLKKSAALRIALIYLVVGAAWILLTDVFLADKVAHEPDKLSIYQTYKGWLFVLVTSILIYWLILRQLTSQQGFYQGMTESENKFRTLVEQSLTGVYIVQDGRFVYANPELERILGYSWEELLALPSFLDVVDEADRELVRENVRKRITGEIETIRYSFHCRRKDGEVIYVEVHGSRIEWEGGPAVIGSLLDMTDWKQAEKEHLLTSVSMNETQDAIYWINRDASFFFVNQVACQMLGYTREELNSMSVFDIDPDFDRERWSMMWDRRQQEGKFVVTIESHHRDSDGRIFPVEIRSSMADYDGETYICAVVRDITARRRKEQEERELKERLELAIASGVVGLWDWDLTTDKVYYSSEWKMQIGYRDHEIGDGFDEWRDRVHPDDLDDVIEEVESFIEGKLPELYVEFRFRHKDGSYRWILARGDVKYDENNKPVRLIGSHTDVTLLKEPGRKD